MLRLTRDWLTLFLVPAFGLALCVPSAFAQKSPEEELKTLRPAEGMELQLFASEPLIVNPSCLDVDSKGRVWVAEIQWYRAKAKNPPADKIKVLEDTDGDGKADKATVFADGLTGTMSLCVAGENIYAIVKGELLHWTDKNDDLKPDGPPKVLLTGFSNQNHDHVGHSLVFGPDHKWYMSHGDTGFNVTGTDGGKIEFKWGAMIRGEQDGGKLETIAVNFRNPYEICVNSFGESYCSDNDNDGNESVRICWILEGGNYGWFGGPPFDRKDLDARVPPGTPFREHWHFRGYQPGYVPATIVTGFGSPCGICYYEGDAFGPAFKNAPLHCDPGPREVRRYPHQPAGFGMKGKSEVFLTNQGDNYFRPDDICAAPDGSLYITDWYDGGVGGHAYNDPDRGRIFRIVPKDKKLTSVAPAGPYKTIGEAVAALHSPNLDAQFQARERLLAEGEKSIPSLENLANFAAADPNFRARALWLLDRIGGEGRNIVAKQLNSKDERFRALAVRILGRHGLDTWNLWGNSVKDESPQVAREALLALRRVPNSEPGVLNNTALNLKGQIVEQLANAAKKYDGTDRYLLETLNVAAAGRQAELAQALTKEGTFAGKQFPLVQLLDPKLAGEYLSAQLSGGKVDPAAAAQLIAAAATQADPNVGKMLAKLFADANAATDIRAAALRAIAGNIGTSWKSLADDAALRKNVVAALAASAPQLQEAALQFVRSAGWKDETAAVLALVNDSKAAEKLRLAALDAAVELRADNLVEQLRKLRSSEAPAIRTAVIKGLFALQDQKSIRDVLTDAALSEAERTKLLGAALESPSGALGLLKLIEDNKLPGSVAKAVLAAAVKHPDSNVRILYERFLPADQRPQKLGDAIKAEEILKLSGNAGRGHEIFAKSNAAQCKNCHMVDGVGGGAIGPDLSLIGKKYERAALLETILLPSKAISHEYLPHLLETTQGQTYLGFLVEETPERVVLKDAQGKYYRVAKSDVESLAKQNVSLMPELVLKDITAQDAADLLAYLTTLVNGTQHVASFQVLGPFDARGKTLEQEYPVEQNTAKPDLQAQYPGLRGKTASWQVVNSDGKLGFAGIDSVAFDQSQGQRGDQVTHYFLVYADSLTDQKAQLQIGSDDGCKVWLNGKQIHKNTATRALAPAQDTVAIDLQRGRNVLLIKVQNGSVPGGVAAAIKSPEPVTLRTE